MQATTLWVIVCKDIDTGEVFVFRDYFDFYLFSKQVRTWIGHNILGFDAPVINKLTLVTIAPEDCIDTLVLSAFYNQGLDGGHSLEAWGQRLKFPKGDFNDWSKFSEEMLTYCINDVHLTHKLYSFLRKRYAKYDNTFKEAIKLEHAIAHICADMQMNGFNFDVDTAKKLWYDSNIILEEIDNEISQVFLPRAGPVGDHCYPKLTKAGTISRTGLSWYPGNVHTDFSSDAPYQRFELIPFNPASPKQVIDWLHEFGWQPEEKTDGHIKAERERDKVKLEKYAKYGWKLSEKNLATLPDTAPPEAHLLLKRTVYNTRINKLEEWINLYNTKTGCIHGSFMGIGTWTHRATHSKPNMANVAAKKSLKFNTKELSDIVMDFGQKMRSLWVADKNSYLVGTDAEGIQLRILAHYMQDEEFTHSVVSGKKEDGTDVHSLNKRKLGDHCKSRDTAKTFIYGYILGAQKKKVSNILNCSVRDAANAMHNFEEGYPGLKLLKEDVIPKDASRGYFEGLDGRYVICEEERLVLAGYLQNGEAIVMKRANVIWRAKLDELKISYKQVNWVHDEWVTKIPRDKELAELVGKIQCEAITQAGIELNVRCPLSGSTGYGDSWYDIH